MTFGTSGIDIPAATAALARAIALHMAGIGCLGAAWGWALRTSTTLERRLGAEAPLAGGRGAAASALLLLLGGWRLLVPLAVVLTAELAPLGSALLSAVLLLAWALWAGFTAGIGLAAALVPADAPRRRVR